MFKHVKAALSRSTDAECYVMFRDCAWMIRSSDAVCYVMLRGCACLIRVKRRCVLIMFRDCVCLIRSTDAVCYIMLRDCACLIRPSNSLPCSLLRPHARLQQPAWPLLAPAVPAKGGAIERW